MWTIAQRRGLLTILTAAAALLALESHLRPSFINENSAKLGSRAAQLANRLDPNTATAADLSSIPQLGRARAAAIVAYRETFLQSHPGQRAFASVSDLTNVKGIGRETAEKWKPNLAFDAPTTDNSE